MGIIPTGENSLPVMNALVGILLASGVSRRVAALSVDMLPLYSTATAFEESLDNYDFGTKRRCVDFHHEMHRFFAGLPADRFPTWSTWRAP